MSPDEKELMELSIKNAILEGFNAFAVDRDKKLEKEIENHRQNCPKAIFRNSFADTVKDWKTIAATILAIAWIISSVISSVTGKPNQLTPEQAKQIVQQLEQVLEPAPGATKTK